MSVVHILDIRTAASPQHQTRLLVKCGIAECGMRKVKCGMQKCGKVCGMVGKMRNAGKDSLQGRSQKLVNLQIALSCRCCAVQWIKYCCRIL